MVKMHRSAYAIYDTAPPPGVPVLEIDPFCTTYFDNPFPAQAQMRDAGPFIWLSQYSVGAVARYENVREVLADWKTFSSARGVGMEDFERHERFRLPSLLLEADPPEHNIPRRAVSRVLSPPVLSTLRAHFEAVAEELVEELVERRQFDGIADLARAYPLRVFPDAIGMRMEGREKLLPHADALFNSFGPRNQLFQASLAHSDNEWIEKQGLRENLTAGGLGMMLHEAADRGEVPSEHAPKLVRALLQAGLDTTVNSLGAALHSLAAFPAEWLKLKAAPGLARNAFEEAIRLESPVQTFFRTATRDAEIDGTRVNEGDKLLMFLGAANRDPRKWDRPDDYDITRKVIGHVGFGSGIHACVGQLIAKLEGELLLAALARRVESISFAGIPQRHYNNTLRSIASMPMEVVPA